MSVNIVRASHRSPDYSDPDMSDLSLVTDAISIIQREAAREESVSLETGRQ